VCCVKLSDFQIPVEDQAASKRSSKAQKKKGKLKNPVDNSNLTAVALASKGSVTAEVLIKGHPDRSKAEPAKEDEIIITTENREQYSEEVCCLFCAAELD
jgi:squalene cyclase